MIEEENLEKIMSKARKLKELSERGIEGEKDAAISAYNAYLKKHDLNDSDINPDMNKRIIEVKDGDHKDVLLNVILSVNPYTRHSDNQTSIECYLDAEDYAEVLKKYEYFAKLLRVERELLITAFLLKHADAFEPDSQAKKKWRERRVENNAFSVKKQEAEIIRQEFNRLQSEKAMNIDVTQKIVEGGDRLKIAAFNQDRTEQLKDILLDAEYVRYRTRIGK
jgi:hypothetical protein